MMSDWVLYNKADKMIGQSVRCEDSGDTSQIYNTAKQPFNELVYFTAHVYFIAHDPWQQMDLRENENIQNSRFGWYRLKELWITITK